MKNTIPPLEGVRDPIDGALSLTSCTLCPRNCGVDRTLGQIGFCGQSSMVHAARAALHFWEEPCISGTNGSGAVFFSGCNMRCIFCQNRSIADSTVGKPVTADQLSEIFLMLQDEKHAHNINLVTPSHFVPQIILALKLAKTQGLNIPIVYNTSSYEKVDTLKQLEGLVDIYLPDLKYMDPTLSSAYSSAPDYFTYASAALREMIRQVGPPVFRPLTSCDAFTTFEKSAPDIRSHDTDPFAASYDNTEDLSETGIMQRGVIVRHLVLPGAESDSRNIIKYLYETYGDSVFISLMNQYTPLSFVANHPTLRNKVDPDIYEALVDYCIELGVTNAFIQDGEVSDESFIPLFDYEGIPDC